MPSRLTVVLVSLLLATPTVAFWLWLVIVPAKVDILFPAECRFQTGRYRVLCDDRTLTTVPLIRFTGVRELQLSGNTIKTFERDCFVSRGLTELESLHVYGCKLRKIEVGAFNWLKNLKEIIISGNDISVIKRGTFKNLRNMKHLKLNYNNIEHLDRDVFSGLVNLKYIDLSNNLLQYLHPDTFLGLPNIQSVSLRFNSYLHILTSRNLINSPSLSYLDIAGLTLSSLSVEMFANVSALNVLDMSHNYLKTVDVYILTTLPKLSELYLIRNRLHCDCQLQKVWQWCQAHNIQTAYENVAPECVTPSEVKGMWWGVLEKGVCLRNNIQYYGEYKNKSSNYTNTYKTYTEMEADTTTATEMDTDTYKDRQEHELFSRFLTKYQVFVYAVPYIFCTISNVILLIIIVCNKDMRTVPNMYFLNLATSDIIYLTVLFSEACANAINNTWLQGEFMCTLLPFCRRLSVGLSAYSVTVISIQRYRVTVKPLHFRVSSQATRRVTVATICGVWILAALFAVPSALSRIACEKFTFVKYMLYYQRVVIFELLVSCALPLCVIAFSNIMTARHLLESSCSLFEGTQNPQLETRRNSAMIVMVLTVVFLITYVPYHAFWAYIICSREVGFFSEKITKFLIYSNNELRYTYEISTCFLLLNSCLNPAALFCTSPPFRQHFKHYLTCFCKTNFLPNDFELTRRN